MDQASREDKKTVITSVSVSKEMQAVIEEYKLSPTEIYRRGIAVMLCDMGISKYDTPLNRERNDYVKDFFAGENEKEMVENLEKMKEILKKFVEDHKEWKRLMIN